MVSITKKKLKIIKNENAKIGTVTCFKRGRSIRTWTIEEDEMIMNKNISTKDLSEELDRTVKAIYKRRDIIRNYSI